MEAKLIYRYELDYDDGAMVRMVVWEVPHPVPPSEHLYKFVWCMLKKAAV